MKPHQLVGLHGFKLLRLVQVSLRMIFLPFTFTLFRVTSMYSNEL
jgi:hypothetical protein